MSQSIWITAEQPDETNRCDIFLVAPESFFLPAVGVRAEEGNRGEPSSIPRSHPESSVGVLEISELMPGYIQ
jgi:hypothetical protein